MITLVICHKDGCPNKGIEYRMEDATPIIMCGGCKEDLIGTIEQEEN